MSEGYSLWRKGLTCMYGGASLHANKGRRTVTRAEHFAVWSQMVAGAAARLAVAAARGQEPMMYDATLVAMNQHVVCLETDLAEALRDLKDYAANAMEASV